MKLFTKKRSASLLALIIIPLTVIVISGQALAIQVNDGGGGASGSQTSPGGGASGSQVSPGSGGTIQIKPPTIGGQKLPGDALTLLKDVINFLTVDIAPVLIALVVLWAAFMFLTAGGDPKKIDTAKRALLYAVIGAVIILVGQGIVLVIENFFGLPTS